MKAKSSIFLVLILILTVALCWGAYSGFSVAGHQIFPGAAKMRMGLDIAGGVRLVYKPVGENITPEGLKTAQTVFRNRLDEEGLNEATVTIDEANPSNPMIVVEIPGFKNPQQASELLGKPAKLQFVEGAEVLNENGEKDFLPNNVVVEGTDIVSAKARFDRVGNDVLNKNENFIELELSKDAVKKFADATERNINKPIFVIFDGDILMAPIAHERIETKNPIITGNYTYEEANKMAKLISSGALPFSLNLETQEYIGPIIGHQAFDITLRAGMFALLFVALFLISVYRLPGLISVINLALYAAIYILIHQWGNITLTLPGIAGMILSIAMAVDSSVIIYERLKEELKAGKTLKTSVDLSFGRAFSAIRDANFTTIISSLALWAVGNGPVQGFAIALFVGTLLSLFMSMIVLRFMMKNTANIFTKNLALYGAKKGGATNEL